MTTTFADYAAQQDARNTIQLNVRKWTLMLCDALKQNYVDYCTKNFGHCDSKDMDDFVIESGRKYHKVIHVQGDSPNRLGSSRSVHAFVDKKTGEVYKSASWKSPAKGVRYDLRLIEDREWLLENADWAGGYLYQR